MGKLILHTAANKHSMLEFGDYDTEVWRVAVALLEQELGFHRTGELVAGLDEGILPSFEKASMKIDAGWDNWAGMYLLANCPSGDDLLAMLEKRLNDFSNTAKPA